LEGRIKTLKDENTKYQRLVIKGAKGSILADQVRDLREKLKVSEEDRDRYEALYNQASYEIRLRDDQIKLLNNAIVSLV